MARISFVMMPEPGHLAPTLRVATFLRRRGHRVTYLACAPFSRWLQGLGFDHVPLPVPSGVAVADDLLAPATSGRGLMQCVKDAMIQPGSSWGECLVDQISRTAPDLVVCDERIVVRNQLALAPRIHCPVVALSVSLPECDVGEDAQIVLCPAELDPPYERGPEPRRYYCEPSLWRNRDAGHWTPRRRRRRLAYCSFGTQSMNYPEALTVLRAMMAAFAGLERFQLVVAAAGLYEQIAGDPRPDNVEVVPSVPQSAVLARADLIVSHVGLGTLKEAVLAGVPILAIPFLYDQPMNARRVEHHGLGRACPPPCCSPATIREIVLDLVDDPDVRQRLSVMRAIFRAREAERPAGHLLLRALAGASL